MRLKRIRIPWKGRLLFVILLFFIALYILKRNQKPTQKYKIINYNPDEEFEQNYVKGKGKHDMDPDSLQFGLDINDFALKLAPKKLFNEISTTSQLKLFDSKISSQKLIKLMTDDFTDHLRSIKDSNNVVILSIVDEEYEDFALNFHLLSIKKHSITNHLFVCLDQQSQLYLHQHNISCHLFKINILIKSMHKLKKIDTSSNFGTLSFAYKTNFKSAVMIQALSKGFNVLMVDVDIIFMKNPLKYFNCSNCALEIQMDRHLYNSGFVFARATRESMVIYETSWNFFIRYQRSHDQSYLNMALDYLLKTNRLPIIRQLPRQLFRIGVSYFEHQHRMFENKPDCEDCVIVHNNYIGSIAAKKYRFRENLLWMVDRNNYYSNAKEKYMIYENRIMFEENTLTEELETLKTAMAIALLLKRVLILPKFHCCECPASNRCSDEIFRCSLLSVLNLASFERAFHRWFRENSFLKHPWVPESIKHSKSPLIYINTTFNSQNTFTDRKKIVVWQPSNSEGITIRELEEWAGKYFDASVLRFYSLNGVLLEGEMARDERFQNFQQMSKDLFVCTEYEQWNNKLG